MVKEPAGDLSRRPRVVQLSIGRLPFYNGSIPLALDALWTGAAGWSTAAPCRGRSPASTSRRQYWQANGQEGKRFTLRSRRFLRFVAACAPAPRPRAVGGCSVRASGAASAPPAA